MLHKKDTSAKFFSVYTFFKDVLLFNINHLVENGQDNLITIALLDGYFSSFQSEKGADFFEYHFNHDNDGKISSISFSIIKHNTTRLSIFSRTLPITFCDGNDVYSDCINTRKFTTAIRFLILDLSLQYNILLPSTYPIDVEETIYLNLIHHLYNVEHAFYNLSILTYSYDINKDGLEDVDNIKNELFSFISLLDNTELQDLIKSLFFSEDKNIFHFFNNLHTNFSKLESYVKHYILHKKMLVHSYFSPVSTDEPILIL